MTAGAYKFLGRGAVGDFGRLRWPAPGTWFDAHVHAYGCAALPSWIDDELWEVELVEPRAVNGVLLATRARLLRRLLAWNKEAARAFTLGCLVSIRAAAAASTAPDGDAFVADAVDLAFGGRPEGNGTQPAPATAPGAGAVAANLGFVASHAAGCLGGDYERGFAAERDRQREWLRTRLGLET